MNPKILLVGYQSDTMQEVYDLLYEQKIYQLIRVQSNEQMIQKLASQTISLTVSDCEVLTLDRMNQIKNLRVAGFGTPLMVLAKAISHDAKEICNSLPRIAVMEKPFSHKHFLGITNKLITGRDVYPQQHKRFFTNQTTVIEHVGNGRRYACSMLNLSKGGAYLEVPDMDATIRGIVRMNIVLDQVQKAYEVNARVVWNSKKSIWGHGQGVGVEFIQAKDIYRNLLNNI